MSSLWSSIKGTVINLGSSINQKEERPEKPIQIMLVTEPQRTKREQFHDMMNEGRETDSVRKTKQRLSDVASGRSFNADCRSMFKCSTFKKKLEGKKNSHLWEIRI